jgi:hypothetical protein
LLHSVPLSGTVVQTKSRQMSKAELTRTLEVASGKSAYKLVIQGCLKRSHCKRRPNTELVVSLKTTKILGLDLPAALLARADEVIDQEAQFAATHESAGSIRTKGNVRFRAAAWGMPTSNAP